MKQDMKYWFTYFLAVLALSITFNIFAGDKEPPAPTQMFYSLNGNANNPAFTTTKPEFKQKSAQEIQLEAQLEAARISNNTPQAKQLRAQLDALHGDVPVVMEYINGAVFQAGPNIVSGEGDYSLSQIHSFSINSAAIATEPPGSPNAGTLWYATTIYNNSGPDTLAIYYSTNNGSTWLSKGKSYLPYNNNYNKDEIDIEMVYDGTNTWFFAVIGLTDLVNGNRKCEFVRFNTANGVGSWVSVIGFPGSSNTMHTYNPRITSDNSVYTSNAYVMIACSMDSATSGGMVSSKLKYALITAPFDATPVINYAQPYGASGIYWVAEFPGSSNAHLNGDIAYYKDDGGTGSGRVVTVFQFTNTGFNNIFMAYLNGYNTLGGNIVLTETNINKSIRLAYNGGANNRNGMITYVRQYNTADWDVFGFRTTIGGTQIGDWTRDTIDFTNDYARTCDLIAVRNASNRFKVGYSQDNGVTPSGYFKSFNNGTWGNKISFTNQAVDTTFAPPRVSYIMGGGDDGVAAWSKIYGYNGYFTGHMESTTGINGHNEIPSGFSLSQNYPNPFNPSTKINFSIPKAGNVSLIVYDITGKVITKLIDGNINSGTYSCSFDASGLSSGVYFYSLKAGDYSDTKKMTLIK